MTKSNVKDVLLRVVVTLATAGIMATTYPLYMVWGISDRMYLGLITLTGTLIIWSILTRFEGK